jgi:DNA-binding MarR family transcriptional regulator
VRSGPLTPTALAGRLGVTKQAASKLADAMVSDGLIRRAADGRDGRQRLLSLAPRGHELLAAVESIYVDLEAEWERVLGRAALADTRQALSTVMLSVNEGRHPDLRPEAVD